MSRRTKLIITALLLVLLGILVVYITCTWHPVDPLRARVLRTEATQIQPEQEPWLTVHLEVRNTSAATIYLGYARVESQAGSYVAYSSPGKSPVSSEVLVSTFMRSTGDDTEVVALRPQERWQTRVLMPSSEEESGPLKDCHLAYAYDSGTRIRIMKWYRAFVSYWPDSWRRRAFPDPWKGHLPIINFHDALTPLAPAQATP